MGKAKTYKAEAVIDLPVGLHLPGDFVGLLKSSSIGGIDVHVVLPDFAFYKGESSPIVHPRAAIDWIGSFASQQSEDDPGHPFGRVADFGGRGKINSLWATRLLILP